MVLYKRKPVKPLPHPDLADETADLWEIEQTGETFSDYAAYLARRDFYLQKVFTCESTGHSGYTFFEAMESEVEASKEINSIFPEGLRARVLEFVQFRNTPRMDDLVNSVYDHFREHYTVGDRVTIETDTGKRNGQIKMMTDTSRLHSMISGQPTDDQFRSYTYEIQMEDGNETLTRYKASELQRDRRVYSKLIIKQFLRSAVSREAWNGAPWIVKDHLAKRYNIPTKVPEAKTRDAVAAMRKAHLNGHVHQPGMPPPFTNGSGPASGRMPPFPGHPNAGPHQHHPHTLPPGFVQADGAPHHQHLPSQMDGLLHPMPFNMHPPDHLLPPHLQQQFALQMPPSGHGLPVSLPFPPNFMQYQSMQVPPDASQQQKLPQQHAPPLAKPFEMIKYPIEDLRIKQPRVSVTRPALKFFSDDVPDGAEAPPDEKKTGIAMKSVGLLLSIWDTLNVHDTIYSLDSFTWDDFAQAMCFSSEEVECELLTEVHCAVLKQYVSDSGKLQVSLPNLADDEDSEDEEEESSKETTPEPEPPVRTTRSSLRKSEANQIIQKERTPTPEPTEIHKAEEFLEDFDWVEQCKIRNFRDGGWQAILVGLLHRLSFEPAHKELCDEVLAKLLPPDEEPSVSTIAYNYVYLDVNLRAAALELVMRLTVTTDHFREQLGASSQEMTRLRKEKIEYQKKRKELADELFKLDIERKIQLPANTPASPAENKEKPDVSMTGTQDVKEEEEAAESEDEGTNRKTRKAANKTKRKRVSEAAKKEKAKKAKIEAAKSKQQREWEQLLEAIENKKEELRECEDNINELDDDLRETMIYRSKVLGKDRFLNKYYWFEANGMPFGGVPNSSTAEYGYANGRVWVQGPDEHEFQPNLEEEAKAQDMAEFGWDVPIRKEREEGSTHLSSSNEWGYIDDIADLDKLMAWLDERGVREKALRKQLLIFHDRIAKYMKIMKEHTEAEKTTEDQEDEDDKPRTRNKAAKDSDELNQRCLQWTNSIMRDELGHNHSEEYQEPKKTRKGVATKKGKGRK